MPPNAIAELFRNFDLGSSGPISSGRGDSFRPARARPDRDFAGMLADNLPARPEPEPGSRPAPVRAEPKNAEVTSQPSGDASAAREDHPPTAAGTDEPGGNEQTKSSTGTAESASASDAASANNESADTTATATGEEAPPAGQAGHSAQSSAHNTSDASTSSGTAPAPTNLGSIFEALSSMNSNLSREDMIVMEPARIENPGPNPGQTGTSAPQSSDQTFQFLRTIQISGTESQAPAQVTDSTASPTHVDASLSGLLETDGETARLKPQAPGNPTTVDNQAARNGTDGQPDRSGTQTQPHGESPRGLVAIPREPATNPGSQPKTTLNDRIAVYQETVRVQRITVLPENSSTNQPGRDVDVNASQGRQPAGARTLALNVAKVLLADAAASSETDTALKTLEQTTQSSTPNASTASAAGPSDSPTQTAIAPTAPTAPDAGPSFRAPAGQPAVEPGAVQTGPDTDHPSPAEQVVRAARAQIGARHSQVRLQLHPPELGQLRINVRINGDALTMQVESTTQAAHQLLQSRVSDLRQALEVQGLTLERVQIDLKGPPQSPSSQNHQGDSGSDHLTKDANPDAHSHRHGQANDEADSEPAQHSRGGPLIETGGSEEENDEGAATASRVNVVA